MIICHQDINNAMMAFANIIWFPAYKFCLPKMVLIQIIALKTLWYCWAKHYRALQRHN